VKPRTRWLPRSTTPLKRRNAKRHAANHLRAYGPEERKAFVLSLPCTVRNSKCAGRMQQAHIETGGTSRKADASKVVSLCRYHHIDVLHRIGRPAFEKMYCVDF